ncbi:hypothetical protein BDF19DRAFT_433986 [Syncephalis fuscata]|nr:hypothetical protein BDF19DRAFT_433986 [Syncephalis fuscata]
MASQETRKSTTSRQLRSRQLSRDNTSPQDRREQRTPSRNAIGKERTSSTDSSGSAQTAISPIVPGSIFDSSTPIRNHLSSIPEQQTSFEQRIANRSNIDSITEDDLDITDPNMSLNVMIGSSTPNQLIRRSGRRNHSMLLSNESSPDTYPYSSNTTRDLQSTVRQGSRRQSNSSLRQAVTTDQHQRQIGVGSPSSTFDLTQASFLSNNYLDLGHGQKDLPFEEPSSMDLTHLSSDLSLFNTNSFQSHSKYHTALYSSRPSTPSILSKTPADTRAGKSLEISGNISSIFNGSIEPQQQQLNTNTAFNRDMSTQDSAPLTTINAIADSVLTTIDGYITNYEEELNELKASKEQINRYLVLFRDLTEEYFVKQQSNPTAEQSTYNYADKISKVRAKQFQKIPQIQNEHQQILASISMKQKEMAREHQMQQTAQLANDLMTDISELIALTSKAKQQQQQQSPITLDQSDNSKLKEQRLQAININTTLSRLLDPKYNFPIGARNDDDLNDWNESNSLDDIIAKLSLLSPQERMAFINKKYSSHVSNLPTIMGQLKDLLQISSILF